MYSSYTNFKRNASAIVWPLTYTTKGCELAQKLLHLTSLGAVLPLQSLAILGDMQQLVHLEMDTGHLSGDLQCTC